LRRRGRRRDPAVDISTAPADQISTDMDFAAAPGSRVHGCGRTAP
jgi:hypothetical protein